MTDAAAYTLLQVPDPLSRQALQRMRTPADEHEADLKFVHYTSPYFERIRYELMRYCNGEINGLSVLISGQRGAGKTTLTKLVIQKAMQESKTLIPLPLMLHGPTIIDSEANPPSLLETFPKQGNAPLEKEKALRQLVTALYRCLSTAIYDAWLIAAEEAPSARRAQRELLSLRAHLDLRLERAPDPDVLRKIWDRAGFIHGGVAFYLRPYDQVDGQRDSRIPPIAGDPEDQGLREIVALSACADAYRVILGETEEKLRREEKAEHSREVAMVVPATAGEKKESAEPKKKSSVEKLAPAALGTLAGGLVSVSHEPKHVIPGLLVGAAVWLGSWISAEFGSRRTRSEMRRELTVNVKWDVNRLERDLPVLLKRVKDAGFAPIFVLDELDKTRDANAALEDFLKLTKHIVTDHAAFLFLTDRDYYEKLIAADNVDWGHTG